MAATVGETRAWLEAAYGIPHADNTHFVIVTCSERGGLGITGCCDGTDEAGQLLAGALSALTGNATPAPASGSVIVSRDDLREMLAHGAPGSLTSVDQATFDRLAEAAGVTP